MIGLGYCAVAAATALATLITYAVLGHVLRRPVKAVILGLFVAPVIELGCIADTIMGAH